MRKDHSGGSVKMQTWTWEIWGEAWSSADFSFHSDICILFLFFFLIEVLLIYNVLLISAVRQSDSVIHIYIVFYIIFHYGLSQDIEFSFLCYTVGPCCLSILYIIVCIC